MLSDYYCRLKAGGASEVSEIWTELLYSDNAVWREFWKGSQFYLDPTFVTGSSFAPEMVLLTLAESYAQDHSISCEAREWLERADLKAPRLRRRFQPAAPPNLPLTLPMPREEFDQFLDFLNLLLLSPNGKFALSRTEKTFYLRHWNLRTGESRSLGQYGGHLCPLHGDRILAAEGPDLLIYDWNFELLEELSQLDDEPREVACTPDLRVLVGLFSKGPEFGLITFNPKTGERLAGWPLEGLKSTFVTLTISDDGKHVAVRCGGHGQVFRLDENARPRQCCEGDGYTRALDARSMMAQEERDTSGRWGRTFLIDLGREKEDVELPIPPSKPADSVFCGKMAIISNQEGDFQEACPVKVWDWSEDEPVLNHRFRLPKPGVKLGVSADGNALAAYCGDGNLRVFNLAQESMDAPLCGHDSTINRLCLSTDGRILASGSTDQTVRVHDLDEGTCLGVYSGRGSWAYPDLSEDGRWLIVNSRDTCELWDLSDQTVREGLFSLCPSGLVVSQERSVLVSRDPDSWEERSRYSCPDIRCFSCSPFASQVAVGHGNGVINIWCPESGQILHKLEFVDEKTGRATDIKSVSWPRPRCVNFAPNVYSNFTFSWHFREQEARSGSSDTKGPPTRSSFRGKSPNGQWSFDFPMISWNRNFLEITHTRTSKKIVWPMAGRALFRNDSELVLGCTTGEIIVFELLAP